MRENVFINIFLKRRMNDAQYYYSNEKCNKHSFLVYCIREWFTGIDFICINAIGPY